MRLHRSEFEQLIRPQIEETVDALRRAVGSAGLAPEQLTAVLLVGGSSRIPLVAQLVSEQLGRPVAVDADPKNAIAKGAALALSRRSRASPGRAPRSRRSPRPAGTRLEPPGVPAPPGPAREWPRRRWPPVAGRAPEPPAAARRAPARLDTAQLRTARAAPGTRPPFPSRPAGSPAAGHPGPAGGPPRTHPGPPPVRCTSRPPRCSPAAPARSEQSWARPQDREDATGLGRRAGLGQPEPPPRRPLGLYVGAAGLAAVALIVVVLLWWPDSSPGLGVNTGNSGGDDGDQHEEAPATPDRW